MLSVVVDGKDGDGWQVLVPILKAKPKMYQKHFKKLIDVLAPKFEAMFLAGVKVRKKDLCTVVSGKQQKCHERAP